MSGNSDHSDMEEIDRSGLHQELPVDFPDPLFRRLHLVIRFAIRVLAVFMVAIGESHKVWPFWPNLCTFFRKIGQI